MHNRNGINFTGLIKRTRCVCQDPNGVSLFQFSCRAKHLARSTWDYKTTLCGKHQKYDRQFLVRHIQNHKKTSIMTFSIYRIADNISKYMISNTYKPATKVLICFETVMTMCKGLPEQTLLLSNMFGTLSPQCQLSMLHLQRLACCRPVGQQ